MKETIPLMKARVEIHIDNKDELIEWCKEALRKEGVPEEAFEQATLTTHLGDYSGDDVYFDYKVDNWTVRYASNTVSGSSSVEFRHLEHQHRILGPSTYKESYHNITKVTSKECNYCINDKRVLLPRPYYQSDRDDGTTLYFAVEDSKRYNTLIVSLNADKKFKYCNFDVLRDGDTILRHSKAIVEFLMSEYDLTLAELLTHPKETTRVIAEESLK